MPTLILYLSDGTTISARCPGTDYRKKDENNEAKARDEEENERQQQTSSHSKLKAAQKSVAARVISEYIAAKVKDEGQIG